MVGHKRERVLGRVGHAVNAAARDFAREAAQLENGGGREAAAERLVKQQVEVVALDKDRVVVETAMLCFVCYKRDIFPIRAYFLLIPADSGHNFHIIAERTRAQKVAGRA